MFFHRLDAHREALGYFPVLVPFSDEFQHFALPQRKPVPRMPFLGGDGAIEKAILASPLDLTPSNDGNVIRIPIPQLTEERRKELVKLVSKLAEEARVSIRNIRRHLVDATKKAQKDGEIPEDDAHKLTAEIQKVTDEFTGKIDEGLKAKEEEIMEV